MSAAEKRLRQASDLMRELAEASLSDGSEARDLWTANPTIDPENNGWVIHHRQQSDVDWDTTVAGLEYDYSGSTARHMAAWHPTVALMVAGWLKTSADRCAQTSTARLAHDPAEREWLEPALKVATAFLAGAA